MDTLTDQEYVAQNEYIEPEYVQIRKPGCSQVGIKY